MKAAKEFNVPKTTLQRRVKYENKCAKGAEKLFGSRIRVFSPAQKEELVNHILTMESKFFGLTTKDVRYLAFHMAEKNHIPHNFNKEERSRRRRLVEWIPAQASGGGASCA